MMKKNPKIRKLTTDEKKEYNMLIQNSSQITMHEYLLSCQRLTTKNTYQTGDVEMIKNVNVYFDDEIYEMLDYLQNAYYQKHKKNIVRSKLIKEIIINSNEQALDLEKIIHSTIQNSLKGE